MKKLEELTSEEAVPSSYSYYETDAGKNKS